MKTSEEYINCYCFNPVCSKSIFNYKGYSAIKMPLSKALNEENCCAACGEELVSRPILEIRSLAWTCNVTMDAAAA